MDRGAEVALPAWLDPERLTEFLTGLRLSGYRLGVNEFIVIQDLVLALIERGERFEDPARLANVLGPVVCKSQAEQADFHKRFADWCVRAAPANKALASQLSGGASSFDRDLSDLGTQRRWWLRAGIAVAMLVAAAVVWLVVRRA